MTTAQGLCDFISAMDTARIQEWNTWYHLLNCGFPLKVSGETGGVQCRLSTVPNAMEMAPAKPAATPKSAPRTAAPPVSPTHAAGTNDSLKTAPAQDTYTVQSGDSLSKIAKNHYGDAGDWKRIYEANKTLIGANPDLIHPGQRLVIPRD